MIHYPRELTDLFDEQDQVLEVASVRQYLPRSTYRWQLERGRWQQPCDGVVVAHSGPLTDEQRLRVALLWAGPGSALAGLTAARLDGLKGFDDRYQGAEAPVHLIAPVGRWVQKERLPFPVVLHYSRSLGPDAVHPVKRPTRTRPARSLVDAASWMATDRGTQAILAAGVQRGLALVDALQAVVAANPRRRRRKLISTTLADIAGGARALSELDFTRLVIRAYRLPEPDRQHRREDSTGKMRYLDACWEQAKLVVEIDGAQHMNPAEYWDDMNRDNDLTVNGYRVLRFPAWLVRYHPEVVAQRIRDALACRGGRGR